MVFCIKNLLKNISFLELLFCLFLIYVVDGNIGYSHLLDNVFVETPR
jgi:hypothetical protein